MNLFDATTQQRDFDAFIAVLDDFLQAVPDDAWALATGTRAKDWTLLQTLAHLESIALLFNLAAACAISGEALAIPHFARREDLRAYNEREIAARAQTPPAEIHATLLAELRGSVASFRDLTPEQHALTATFPVYQRPIRVVDCVDFQLSHAGIVHAAQLTRPLDLPPLWEHYAEALLARQVERFVRHFSYAYWPEAAPELDDALNISIGGATGGDFHLTLSPRGSLPAIGHHPEAGYHVHFADVSAFFGVFTVHLPVAAALATEQMRVRSRAHGGDVSATLAVLRLFSAMPPPHLSA